MSIQCNFQDHVDGKAADRDIRIEYQESHDSIRDGYFRVRLGWDMCLMLSPARLAELRDKLSAALDAQEVAPEPECDCQQTDVDRVDASTCPIHGGR